MTKLFTSKSLPFLLWGIGMLVLFVAFSFLVHKNLFTHFDFDTTVRLQQHFSRRWDVYFSTLSDIGTFEVVSVFLLILLVVRRKLMGIFVLFFYGAFHAVEIYGKTFVSHLPPPEFMLRTQHVVQFPEFHVTLQNSYPSGHAARALFITTLLTILTLHNKRLLKWQKWICVLGCMSYDVAMCVSRVYLGEHWTSDVIGGSLLGLGCVLLGAIFIA